MKEKEKRWRVAAKEELNNGDFETHELCKAMLKDTLPIARFFDRQGTSAVKVYAISRVLQELSKHKLSSDDRLLVRVLVREVFKWKNKNTRYW